MTAVTLSSGLGCLAILQTVRLPEVDGLQIRLLAVQIDGRAASGQQEKEQEAGHVRRTLTVPVVW